jgi:hypothetical protein
LEIVLLGDDEGVVIMYQSCMSFTIYYGLASNNTEHYNPE